MALTETDHNGKRTGLINTLKSGVRKEFPAKHAEFSTEGLPNAFLHSLRTLFDILDDGRRGYVHISEIESRWRGAEARDLPAGVVESLRRVTPHHGCLSFERFVAGLRNSLLTQHCQPQPFQCKVRPLGPSNGINTHHSRQMGRNRHLQGSGCPNKPAESSQTSLGCGGFERSGCMYRSDSIRIEKKAHQSSQLRSIDSLALESPNVPKTFESVGLPQSQSETASGFMRSRRHGRSRDEQRRHTITNGVDYGMLKQMKELEQEKDSLLAGLDVLEQAREWYQTRIHNVTETQRQVGQSHQSTEFFAESCQSRMDLLLPKLQEVTRCLNDLISFSETALPSGSSLSASSSYSAPPAPPQAILILKEQNRLLTQEVTEKSERITQLEQEKSALIKQLFEARARNTHDSSALDSTFI
ncbi:suppressor APC domain-containing protein 2-like isoform X1 [Myxocyprinus asiaticus]|uniref:suppressor APC domain-containing protein 2-like isoform X1 n=1 Tax=Myxocyprinus asiaticus TaxID=70543 RepID=UPI0022227847|nr:suppressor APC domain-containing protein 2-like isoform X1 [Myxocyprinus asiaticus]